MKVMIVGNNTKMLINFRGDLIREMATLGHDIITVSPDTGYEEKLRSLGASFERVSLSSTGINPIEDIKFVSELVALMRKSRPDIIFAYTIKPVIYSSIAAKLSGVKRIYSAITGLGYAFAGSGRRAMLVRYIAKAMYSLALRISTTVVFENPDDMNDFVKWRLVTKSKCVRVNGVGVNMERFSPAPLPVENAFLMVCRILRDKGVLEYLSAARLVKANYPDTRFYLLGPFDANPHALMPNDISPFVKDGTVNYLGEVEDVRPYIAASSFFVLPSYREGTPRSTLEAMAMGRPIITTDVPGCRETVVEGANGFLVPVMNVDNLASRMMWMIEHRDQAKEMGLESQRMCSKKFDVRSVNKMMLDLMGL